MISGIINVLKPAGMTSNAVLTKIKKKFHPNKIGHLGTLDPDATGVLPVCINKATKLFNYYLNKEKIYRTVFVFGKETDTLDSSGKIICQDDKIIGVDDIASILPSFVGKQEQIPPKYSAKKINGKKAYELARNDVDFEVKPKEIEIYSIDLLKQISKNTFLFEIRCSSGTYVRSVARDIAKRLNTVAYVGAIIRTKSGNFDIENSTLLDDITENSIVSLKNVLQDKQKVFILDTFYDKITNGCEIEVEFEDLDSCVVYCKDKLIGIGQINQKKLKITTNLLENYD